MTLPPPDSSLLRILPEIRDALSAGRPVVALESTIISHEIGRASCRERVY